MKILKENLFRLNFLNETNKGKFQEKRREFFYKERKEFFALFVLNNWKKLQLESVFTLYYKLRTYTL